MPENATVLQYGMAWRLINFWPSVMKGKANKQLLRKFHEIICQSLQFNLYFGKKKTEATRQITNFFFEESSRRDTACNHCNIDSFSLLQVGQGSAGQVG